MSAPSATSAYNITSTAGSGIGKVLSMTSGGGGGGAGGAGDSSAISNINVDHRFPSQFRQFLDGTLKTHGSRVIVAATTNQIDKIPADLIHRGEVIRFGAPPETDLRELWAGHASHLPQ